MNTQTEQSFTLDGLMELVRLFGGARWSERVDPSKAKERARVVAYSAVVTYAEGLRDQGGARTADVPRFGNTASPSPLPAQPPAEGDRQ